MAGVGTKCIEIRGIFVRLSISDNLMKFTNSDNLILDENKPSQFQESKVFKI